MKKFIYGLIIFCSIFLLCGCEKNSSLYLKTIDYKELNSKIEKKETFFFVITQDGCSHCESFLPVLEKVLNDKKVVGYNVNTSKLSEEESDKIYKDFNVSGTPTTIFMKDGVEISLLQRIVGEADEDRIIQKLKNNGYVE